MIKGASIILASTLIAASSANAADLGQVRLPDGRIAEPSMVLGLEVSPSFFATTNPAHFAGNYDDSSISANLTHEFASGFFAKGNFKADIKPRDNDQFYVEASLGYRLRWHRFTLSPSALIGNTWGSTGFGRNAERTALYYALYLAGDFTLDKHWTWNAFTLRYRDAFEYEWVTPEIASGLTYRVDDKTSLYGSGSYSWKNIGEGLHGDTFGVAFGIKHAL